jgi:hypothetical protein
MAGQRRALNLVTMGGRGNLSRKEREAASKRRQAERRAGRKVSG